MLIFHGGGNTALYHAQASEWPLIGKEYGFITVAVDLHYPNTTAAQTVELLDHLKSEYAVDPSRVYASGFSMGSIKSWDLFEQYPTLFAGVAPMDGANNVGIDSYNQEVEYNTDVVVPVFYVGGQTSPLPELANQDPKIQERIAYAFSVNGVKQEYTYNENVNLWWGVNGDHQLRSHRQRLLYQQYAEHPPVPECRRQILHRSGRRHQHEPRGLWPQQLGRLGLFEPVQPQ